MRFLIFSLLFIFSMNTGLIGQGKVKWLTWEEALEKNQKIKKKFLVDVYTNWCTWCKKMEKSTFSNDVIASYINENYYPVKFNAEQKSDIIYNNKIYKYIGGFGRKGYHELAKEILRGKLSYPTVVFIEDNLEVIQPIPGFQDVKNFEMIMTYFAEDFYKQTPWKKFVGNFNSKHFPTKPLSPGDLQPRVQTVKNK